MHNLHSRFHMIVVIIRMKSGCRCMVTTTLLALFADEDSKHIGYHDGDNDGNDNDDDDGYHDDGDDGHANIF